MVLGYKIGRIEWRTFRVKHGTDEIFV